MFELSMKLGRSRLDVRNTVLTEESGTETVILEVKDGIRGLPMVWAIL